MPAPPPTAACAPPAPAMAARAEAPIAASWAGDVRGECPSVRRPFVAGDGLLARVRVPGGALTPDQARALAAGAGRHGNGVVELTSRANVQVRGVRPDTLAALVTDLTAAGLVADDPRDEPSADVLLPALAGLDPTERLDVRPLAATLRERLRVGTTGPLHHKAAVALDGGGTATPTPPTPADVTLTATPEPATGEVVLALTLAPASATPTAPTAGLMAGPDAPEQVVRLPAPATPGPAATRGPAPAAGPDAAALVVTVPDAPELVVRLPAPAAPGPAATRGPAPAAGPDAAALVVTVPDAPELVVRLLGLAARGTDAVPGPARVRDLVAAHGVVGTLRAAGAVLDPPPLGGTGLAAARRAGAVVVRVLPPTRLRHPVATTPAAAAGADRAVTPLGVVAVGDGDVVVGALPALGRLDADGLRGLADAAERRGEQGRVELRLTSGRGVVVTGLPGDAGPALRADLDRLGFVTGPDDPAAGVVACAGRPGCAAAHADTRSDGGLVAAHLAHVADPAHVDPAHVDPAHGGPAERRPAEGRPAEGRPATVHLSGCGKRCASRQAHDLTLVAEPDGRYAVLVGPDETPAGHARGVGAALALASAATATAGRGLR